MHFALKQFLPHSFNQQWAECSSVAAGCSKEKAKQTAGLHMASFGNEGRNPIKDMHIFYLNLQRLHHRAQTAFRVPYTGNGNGFHDSTGTTNWATSSLKSSNWSYNCQIVTNRQKTPEMVSNLVLLQLPPCEAHSNDTQATRHTNLLEIHPPIPCLPNTMSCSFLWFHNEIQRGGEAAVMLSLLLLHEQ